MRDGLTPGAGRCSKTAINVAKCDILSGLQGTVIGRIPTLRERNALNANSFATDLRIDDAGHTDYLIILGAGTADDPYSVRNDDDTAWDLWIPVEPSEDSAPYEKALRAAGFRTAGPHLVERL